MSSRLQLRRRCPSTVSLSKLRAETGTSGVSRSGAKTRMTTRRCSPAQLAFPLSALDLTTLLSSSDTVSLRLTWASAVSIPLRLPVRSLTVAGPKDAVYHYHSIYDSFTWMDKFADPGFHRHVGVAKTLGLLSKEMVLSNCSRLTPALRLADSLLLPINITQYALELDTYLDK